MPSNRPRSSSRSRSLIRVVTLAVVGAVVFGGASAATAFALDAQQGAPAASVVKVTATATATTAATTAASPRPAAPAATVVHGWADAPKKVRAGKTYRAFVLVTGERRTVRLERLVRSGWKVLDTDRTSKNGAAVLAWRTPKTAGKAVLRVHVLRAAHHRSATTARSVLTTRAAAATGTPTAAPTATASPQPSTTPAPITSAEETLRAQLLTLVNQARASARTCGGTAYPAVAALKRSTALDTAAGAYALKMGKERFFAHESPDGSTMVSRLKAVGIANTTERENIAAGQTSAASVMTGWLKSEGHCKNIMAGDVTRIGLGHATVAGSPYGQYWVQDFAG